MTVPAISCAMGHPFNFCDYMVCRVDKVLIERTTDSRRERERQEPTNELTFPVEEELYSAWLKSGPQVARNFRAN